MKRLINASVSTAIKFMEQNDLFDRFFNEYKAENYFAVDGDELDFWNYDGFIDDLYEFVETQTRSKTKDVEEAFEVFGVELKNRLIDYINDNEEMIINLI